MTAIIKTIKGHGSSIVRDNDLEADLTYDSEDPAFIGFDFYEDEPDAEVTMWTISRELIAEAFDKPTQNVGTHDVIAVVGKELLRLTLRGDFSAQVLLPAEDVKSFLEATYALVGRGEESYDWDEITKKLLSQ